MSYRDAIIVPTRGTAAGLELADATKGVCRRKARAISRE